MWECAGCDMDQSRGVGDDLDTDKQEAGGTNKVAVRLYLIWALRDQQQSTVCGDRARSSSDCFKQRRSKNLNMGCPLMSNESHQVSLGDKATELMLIAVNDL